MILGDRAMMKSCLTRREPDPQQVKVDFGDWLHLSCRLVDVLPRIRKDHIDFATAVP